MSSPPSKPKRVLATSKPGAPPPTRRRAGFETWRKIMLAGALLLLGTALAAALIDEPLPRPVYLVANAAGYVLLAIGFGMRMKDRGIRP